MIDALFALRHDRRGWSEVDESFQEVMRRLRLAPSEIPKRASPTERDEIYIQRFLKADLSRMVCNIFFTLVVVCYSILFGLNSCRFVSVRFLALELWYRREG